MSEIEPNPQPKIYIVLPKDNYNLPLNLTNDDIEGALSPFVYHPDHNKALEAFTRDGYEDYLVPIEALYNEETWIKEIFEHSGKPFFDGFIEDENGNLPYRFKVGLHCPSDEVVHIAGTYDVGKAYDFLREKDYDPANLLFFYNIEENRRQLDFDSLMQDAISTLLENAVGTLSQAEIEDDPHKLLELLQQMIGSIDETMQPLEKLSDLHFNSIHAVWNELVTLGAKWRMPVILCVDPVISSEESLYDIEAFPKPGEYQVKELLSDRGESGMYVGYRYDG